MLVIAITCIPLFFISNAISTGAALLVHDDRLLNAALEIKDDVIKVFYEPLEPEHVFGI